MIGRKKIISGLVNFALIGQNRNPPSLKARPNLANVSMYRKLSEQESDRREC